MVVTCDIDFDGNPNGIYYAGQVVTGRITLKSDKAKQVKGVVLKIKGFVHVRWTEDNSTSTTDALGNSTTQRTTESYTAHEDYLSTVTYLIGTPDDREKGVIEPGIYSYTFAFHIPAGCPSSFEGYYGHIRYLAKVELIRPWKFNQTYTRGLTVLKVLDLNYDSPLLRVPSNVMAEKTFCCGPCRSEPLRIEMHLTKGGYVPGEFIPVNIIVTNDCKIRVEEIKISLVMAIRYESAFPRNSHKTENIVLTIVKGDPVEPYCKKSFNYGVLVPATPPTCITDCRFIQITYKVQAEASVNGMHRNQVLFQIVTIGNVPLMKVIQQQPTRGMSAMEQPPESMNDMEKFRQTDGAQVGSSLDVRVAAVTSDEIETYAVIQPWTPDPSIEPPNYEEAIHGQRGKITADEQNDYGPKEFAPRYPVFNVLSASTSALKYVEDDTMWL